MNPLILIVACLMLLIGVVGVAKSGWEVYLNLKRGKRLTEGWGALACIYIGLVAFGVYHVLPKPILADWHQMLAFIGVNLLMVGAFLRLRLLWANRNEQDGGRVPKKNTPERIANR